MTFPDQVVALGRGSAQLLLREPPRPAVVRNHHLAPWLAVATVCFGAFMGQLDASIVTLAFPALQRDFGAHLAGVQWVSLAYLLTLITLLVPVGRWSDRFGRKLVYLYGFVVFTAASAACGLAPTLLTLVVLRVLQAFGAAMLQANSVALVSTSARPHRRRAALGIQAAAQALGLALGPVLGGLLVSSVGWRWVFFINVPVGIIALATGWFLLPRTRERSVRVGSDPAGLILLAAAATGLLVAVSGLSGLGISGPVLGGLAASAALAAATFFWWEKRAKAPLIDLPALTSSGIAPMLGGALLAYMILFGPLVLFPQVMGNQGSTVLQIGIMLAALPAGFGIAAVASERILPSHWPDHGRCLIGGLLAVACSALLAVPLPVAARVLLLGVLGVGLGIYIPANNTGIMTSVPPHQAATTGGMVNIARGLGTALGVAIVPLALGLATYAHLTRLGPAAAMAVLAVAAVAATWTGWRRRTSSRRPAPVRP